MAAIVEGWQINDTLRTVRALHADGDAQLTILARSLVIACKSTQVDKETMLAQLAAAYDEPTNLVPLDAVTQQ